MNTAKLRELLMNDNGFAFDQATGYTYNIHGCGIDIIRWMKDNCDEDALVRRITATYDVDADTAQRDLDAFLNMLSRYGLISYREEARS